MYEDGLGIKHVEGMADVETFVCRSLPVHGTQWSSMKSRGTGHTLMFYRHLMRMCGGALLQVGVEMI